MLAKKLHDELSHQGVTLVSVTKNQSTERIQPLYDAGLREFGENRVQELTEKHEAMSKDIRWHLIGHLQTNKVKHIAPFIHLVHSIDGEKLLSELNRQAEKNNRVIDFLLQLHVAQEATKHGLSSIELLELATPENLSRYPNVRLRGVMTLATNTDDQTLIRSEFETAQSIYQTLQQRLGGSAKAKVDILSMGMSGDYKIAIKCGANMVRIGSLLFEN
jgi:PLP dependent protein